MRKSLVVEAAIEPPVRLRSAKRDDLNDLRRWKNSAKENFFYKGEINELMQKAWFAAYVDRKDDYMFIVEHDGKKIGCVVLKGNAALNFYDRCGFWISGSAADHDVLTLNWPKFKPLELAR